MIDSSDDQLASIISLIRSLIKIPSRGGKDEYESILNYLDGWFRSRGIVARRVISNGATLGLYVEVPGAIQGPRYVMNATLDTADIGDELAWSSPPFSARIISGWLYGRGSADSKAAVAIFAHLAVSFMRRGNEIAGTLDFLFDLDEHTGTFSGARAFFELMCQTAPNGVIIGYPGLNRIVVGARGFLRAIITVHGIGAHSGSSRSFGVNAAIRGAKLALELNNIKFPEDDIFGLPAKITITNINSHGSFGNIPDRCELQVDIRLTPKFNAEKARAAVLNIVESFDAPDQGLRTSTLRWIEGWPAYRIEETHPIIKVLRDTSHRELGKILPLAVSGPSNVGNYLASIGVHAMCGFGVQCEGVHSADERIKIGSIAPVYRVYEQTLLQLMRVV
ncbi:M20 family metallopeptidase [Burkholderia cepacia]|uniref:M20 family metallopeptidase n=1 Tax=Burkholderia cepacia TaxID=292 RepID=UPI002AB7F1BB|nr:M20/M25/M40 family metallo-hydrolase [Burkholderia cepacia]